MFSELYITNRRLCPCDLVERIGVLASRGPKYIILREKDLREEEYLSLAQKAIVACRPFAVTLVLHSFAACAERLNHPYIHLPMKILREMPEARRKWFQVLGASCHSQDEALEAQSLDCTYLTTGHIFATECKAGLPGRGLDFLREICQAVALPVYALGGITPENRASCLAAGAAGTAVMSAAMWD